MTKRSVSCAGILLQGVEKFEDSDMFPLIFLTLWDVGRWTQLQHVWPFLPLLWVKAVCICTGTALKRERGRVCVCMCVWKQGLGCMQMVHEPTFQLGPQYKYPWLIGMWRLLAQKDSSAWRVSRTPSLTHARRHAGGRPRLPPPHSNRLAPPPSLDTTFRGPPSFLHSWLFSSCSPAFCCVSCQLHGLTLHLKETFSWTRLEF